MIDPLQTVIQIRSTLHRLTKETLQDTQAVTGMIQLLPRPDLEALAGFTLLLLRKTLQRDADTLGQPEPDHIDQTLDEMRQWLTE